jgi:murein DD-endopeptidase MepM/ murein hydrolase activator NlpD
MEDSERRPSRSVARDWMAEMPGTSAVAAAPARRSALHRFTLPAIAVAVVAFGAAAVLAGLALAAQAGPSLEPTAVAMVATPSPTPTPEPTPSPTPTPEPTPVATGTVIDVGPGPAPTTPTPTPPDKLTGYLWPLDDANGFKITLPFGPSPWGEFIVNGKLFHDGVDMATQCNDKVRAAHDGVVLTAGRDYVRYMGWQGDVSAFEKRFATASWKVTLPIIIVIDDGDGYRSIYAHEGRVVVRAGQKVTAGQIIGYEGQTGNASGCHLHFGMYSPLETATIGNLPKFMAKPYSLPATATARVDPLLVLPYRNDVAEMRALRPWDAALWDAAHPSPTPKS